MFQQVVAEIESGSVFFDMAVSNTPKAALRRLESSPVLQEARKSLVLDPEDAYFYLENAKSAFNNEAPAGYASPEDGALAAYVSVLAHVPEESIQKFIDEIAASGRTDLRKAVWTARYYAERVPSLTVQKVATTPADNSGFASRPPNRVFSVSDLGLSWGITVCTEFRTQKQSTSHCRTLVSA